MIPDSSKLYLLEHDIILGENLYRVINRLVLDDTAFEYAMSIGDDSHIDEFLGIEDLEDPEIARAEMQELWKKGHKFNFKRLEDKVNIYYKAIRTYEKNTASNKYKMALVMFYKSVANLTFGIFSVNPPDAFSRYSLDSYDEACSYALHLTDRVRLHSLNWGHEERNAWTQYIRLNTRYAYTLLPTMKSREFSFDKLLEELDKKLTSGEEEETVPTSLAYRGLTEDSQTEFLEKLFVLLTMYYEKEEIQRLLPITFSSLMYKFSPPEDVVRFKNFLLVITKRLISYYSEAHLLKTIPLDQSINKSAIILILLSYLSNTQTSSIPMELTTSLDFYSLVRLASVAGGETITIPTVDEIESVIASCIAIAAVMFDGIDVYESRYIAKRSVGFKKDVRRLNRYIKNITDELSIQNLKTVIEVNKSMGEPFMGELVNSLRLITSHQTSILDKLEENLPNLSFEELVDSLSALDGSEKKLVGLIERMAHYTPVEGVKSQETAVSVSSFD